MSREIEDLEYRLREVRSLVERDTVALESTDTPRAARLFLRSLELDKKQLETELKIAKSDRDREVVRLRLMGNQVSYGSIPLRLLARLAQPLNAALECASWRVWDKDGDGSKIDEKFVRMLDLRLAGIQSGSAELVLVGNVAPDLTGESALEIGLRKTFELLNSSGENLTENVNEVGLRAARAIGDLMTTFEKEHLAVEATWISPASERFHWYGRPDEITRVRTLLDELGEPEIIDEVIAAEVTMLSLSGRLELRRVDSDEKLKIAYAKPLAESVKSLRLGERRQFLVQRTSYPVNPTHRKKDAFRLLEIRDKEGREASKSNRIAER